MVKKATEKKVAKKRTVKKKSDTVPTRKVQNKCDIRTGRPYIEFVKELKQPKMDYNRYYYDELNFDKEDKWANKYPSSKPKRTPEWKNLPNQDSEEWFNLSAKDRQLNYKPTDDDMMRMPNYFMVMELAKKYPEQRTFFHSLANYMETTCDMLFMQSGVLNKMERGSELNVTDGIKLQKSHDKLFEAFLRLKKAVKKAKE